MHFNMRTLTVLQINLEHMESSTIYCCESRYHPTMQPYFLAFNHSHSTLSKNCPLPYKSYPTISLVSFIASVRTVVFDLARSHVFSHVPTHSDALQRSRYALGLPGILQSPLPRPAHLTRFRALWCASTHHDSLHCAAARVSTTGTFERNWHVPPRWRTPATSAHFSYLGTHQRA